MMRATVTQLTPLEVQIKGRTPKPAQHTLGSVGTLAVGDKVAVDVVDRLLVVIGKLVAA